MSTPGPAELFSAALAAHQGGDLRRAATLYQQTIAASPDHVEAIHHLGLVAYQSGDARNALPLIRRSIALSPGNANYRLNLTTVLHGLNQPAEALAECDRAIALGAEPSAAQYARGNALLALQRFADAEASFRRVVAIKPEFASAWNRLGAALLHQERVDEAIAAYERATALDSNDADAWNNLGLALTARRELDDALRAFERALHAGDDPETHFNRALARLIAGDYARGWDEYEHCRRVPRFGLQIPQLNRPIWAGDAIAGKTLLVYCEQGAGDCIQFARYIPLIASGGTNVIFVAPPDLVSLFESLRGVGQVIARGTPLPPFDVHCPLSSLPRLTRTRIDTIPAEVPYLAASERAVDRWRKRMVPHLGDINIALVWSGSDSGAYPRRSIPPELLAPLGSVRGVKFFSLQKSASAEPPFPLINLTTELATWDDTAALLRQMDLLIAVDTGVAHLAGALGKEAWLMLHHAPDFRWPYDSDRSPWYPTARLFHQPKCGDWSSVIERVCEQLTQLVATR